MPRHHFLILLIGGYAASHAATAIRERDSEGSIVLLTAEEFLPYERPPLSKQMLFADDFKPEDAYVQPQNDYDAKTSRCAPMRALPPSTAFPNRYNWKVERP